MNHDCWRETREKASAKEKEIEGNKCLQVLLIVGLLSPPSCAHMCVCVCVRVHIVNIWGGCGELRKGKSKFRAVIMEKECVCVAGKSLSAVHLEESFFFQKFCVCLWKSCWRSTKNKCACSIHAKHIHTHKQIWPEGLWPLSEELKI